MNFTVHATTFRNNFTTNSKTFEYRSILGDSRSKKIKRIWMRIQSHLFAFCTVLRRGNSLESTAQENKTCDNFQADMAL